MRASLLRAVGLGAALFLLGPLGACERLPDSGGDGGTDVDGGVRTPSAAEIEDAKQRLKAFVFTLDFARDALEMLGILPEYDCGEPRRTFVGRVTQDLMTQVACATVATEQLGDTGDRVTITFPASGCEVRGHTASGPMIFEYSGGESRLDLAADLQTLSVDGRVLQTTAGYGTCGDIKSVWVKTMGDGFAVDASLSLVPGLPIIGSDTMILNGTAQVTDTAGTDTATFQELAFEVGKFLPKSGTLIITTAGGHTIKAVFSDDSPVVGTATITIDSYDPVTVPIPS